MNDSVLSLLASITLLVLMAASGAVGFAYGKEVGRCEVGCAKATAGMGTASYMGGACRCLIHGEEVRPL
jgi:hypothetical protein